MLSRYYAHYSTGVALDFANMTIEHLAPENAANPSVAPADVAKIGNLILVDESLNNKLANKQVREKQAILKQHPEVWVDPSVLSAKQWTAKEIGARSAAMADVAFNKIWTF